MLRLGLVLLIVPSIVLMTAYMMEQNQVRACLDAGSVWDYQNAVCLESGDFPFVSFMQRHPYLVNGGMLLSVLGTFMTVIGLYRPSQRRVVDE